MSRYLINLHTEADRNRAVTWCRNILNGWRVEFRAPKRTTEQNDRMWAMLTDISRQIEWDGAKRTTDDWKDLFMDWLPRELRTLTALDGSGRQVPVGRSTSNLTKSEMSDLMALMEMFGANNGVKFKDDECAQSPNG